MSPTSAQLGTLLIVGCLSLYKSLNQTLLNKTNVLYALNRLSHYSTYQQRHTGKPTFPEQLHNFNALNTKIL